MLEKYNRYCLVEQFFDQPRKGFHIRELSRNLKLAQASVINHLKALLKEKLIVKQSTDLYMTYKANIKNTTYKLLKRNNLLLRIHKIGIISLLDQKIRPNTIILFGSASYGEDTEESDVDLFVQGGETPIDLQPYEKKLYRKINLLFESDLKNISKELKNNLSNGIVLSGYFKVL